MLKKFLNQLYVDFHKNQYLYSDPLEFAHRFSDPWDQETIALLAAVLAYGNVKQIRASLHSAIQRIGQLSATPSEFVRNLSRPSFKKKAQISFQDFVHRFNQGEDLIILFELLGRSWRKHGSLGAHFLSFHRSSDPHIEEGLSKLISEWRSWNQSSNSPSFSYLLTSPQDGSCCKRWCMFLRWMGRKDHLDLGLWSETSPLAHTFPHGKTLKPSQLIMPLDTHTGRISQYLGLTHRKTLNWKAAVEVTESLKKIDPKDPTRYDFAISRLGILDLCQRTYRKEICQKCQLVAGCQFALNHSSGHFVSMRL